MRGLTLLFTLHFGRSPQTPADPWFGTDKAQHFFIAAFVESVSFSGLRVARVNRTGSLVGATAVAGTVSIGKEVYDAKHHGDPSLTDLTWDAAGIVASAALLVRTER